MRSPIRPDLLTFRVKLAHFRKLIVASLWSGRETIFVVLSIRRLPFEVTLKSLQGTGV